MTGERTVCSECGQVVEILHDRIGLHWTFPQAAVCPGSGIAAETGPGPGTGLLIDGATQQVTVVRLYPNPAWREGVRP